MQSVRCEPSQLASSLAKPTFRQDPGLKGTRSTSVVCSRWIGPESLVTGCHSRGHSIARPVGHPRNLRLRRGDMTAANSVSTPQSRVMSMRRERILRETWWRKGWDRRETRMYSLARQECLRHGYRMPPGRDGSPRLDSCGKRSTGCSISSASTPSSSRPHPRLSTRASLSTWRWPMGAVYFVPPCARCPSRLSYFGWESHPG